MNAKIGQAYKIGGKLYKVYNIHLGNVCLGMMTKSGKMCAPGAHSLMTLTPERFDELLKVGAIEVTQ